MPRAPTATRSGKCRIRDLHAAPDTALAAGEAHLTGVAEAVLAFEWSDPTHVDDYFFNPVAFEGAGVEASFLPDHAYLSALQATFGGTTVTEVIFEGTSVVWLGYDTARGRTTFVSLRAGEGDNSIAPRSDRAAAERHR